MPRKLSRRYTLLTSGPKQRHLSPSPSCLSAEVPSVCFGWNDAVWKVTCKPGRKRASGFQWTADFFLWRRKPGVPLTNLCLPMLPSRTVGFVGCRNLRGFLWKRAVISRTTWKKVIYRYTKLSSVIGILDSFYFSVSTVLIQAQLLYFYVFIIYCTFVSLRSP